MKKLVFFVLLMAVVFALGFTAARFRKAVVTPACTAESVEGTFRATSFALNNHAFVVVITAVNNGCSAMKTISSVFSQNYDNYRVIYIDDASDDGSFDLARDLISDTSKFVQVTVVRNEERLGQIANVARAIATCADDEIVVVLHGEDWLAHEWVLQRLNAYYANPDLWMTYGQYRDYPTYELGTCRPFKDFEFRKSPFVAFHLKTFYAGLFKKIRETDFLYQGRFLTAGSEIAIMVPMLEMARDHFQFVPEVLYISNRQAGYLEDRELLIRSEKWTRSLEPYAPLTEKGH